MKTCGSTTSRWVLLTSYKCEICEGVSERGHSRRAADSCSHLVHAVPSEPLVVLGDSLDICSSTEYVTGMIGYAIELLMMT